MKLNKEKKKNWFSKINLLGFIKEIIFLLRYNIKTLVLYVLLFFVLNGVISYSIYNGGLSLLMKIKGLSYIDGENILVLISNPLIVLLLIVGLLLFSMLSVFEVSGVIHIFTMNRIGLNATIKSAMAASLRGCFKMIRPQNWLVFLYLLVFLPLLGIFSVSTNYMELFVPEFIMDFINANTLFRVLWIGLAVASIVFLVISCFSIHFFFTGQISYIEACKQSIQLIKKRIVKTIVIVAAAILLFYTFIVGISAVLANVTAEVAALFKEAQDSNAIMVGLNESDISNAISIILFEVINPVLNLSVLTALFFEYLDEDGTLTIHLTKDIFKPKPIGKKIIPVLAFTLLCICYFAYSHYNYYDSYITNSLRSQIIAHRGDSIRAPENTYPAFEIAIVEDVDCIELDVQMTKDGIIVVSHDDSIKKFTGENKGIHQLTYAELMKIDVGSRFSKEYEGLHFSTLDEVLKLIKEESKTINVQIEIKVSEYDHHLEEELIKVIYDNQMQERVSIISLSTEPLKRIHQLDENLHLIYTMSLAYGDVTEFDIVDGYSIEQSNISLSLVQNIHKKGKKVYAWTANTGKTIQYLVDCGVDGILTDDPIMLDTALDLARYKGGISKVVRVLINLLSVH